MKKYIWVYFSISFVILSMLLSSCKKEEVPVLTTTEITSITGSSAKSGGNITDEGSSRVIARGVCWSTNQLPTILDKKTSDSTGGGSFSSSIGDLERFTTYYVRAYATNGLGTTYGNQVSFTSHCLWAQVPIMLDLISPVNGAIEQPINPTLNWAYMKAGNNGRFDVYFGTSPDPTAKIATNLSSTSVTLSGLDLNTTYYWKIFGWESSYPCNNITTDIWHFYTGGPTPPKVSTIVVPEYTYTSATVGGYATSEGGLIITEWGVYWGTSQNPESTGTKLQIGSGTGSFSTSLSGLNPNTTYFVKAYATNLVGTAYGSQVSFNIDQNTTIPTISDIEGNIYHIVTIGAQVWMAENLKTTKYSDATSIPLVTDNSAWNNLTTPGYCWYKNDEATYKNTYGALYNWYTVNTGNLCPTGWHVPTDAEWTTLTTYLGGESVAGGKLKETGTAHWHSPNTGATNESGFTALPGGIRYNTGTFNLIGDWGGWWSSTEYDAYNAWDRSLYLSYGNVLRYSSGHNKNIGVSVRCLRD